MGRQSEASQRQSNDGGGQGVIDSALVVTAVGAVLVLSGVALHQGLGDSLRWALLLAGAALVLGLLYLAWRVRWKALAARQLEEDLRQTRARLSASLWGSGEGLWIWDLQRRELQSIAASDVTNTRIAFTVSEQEWRDRIVHPEDFALISDALAALVDGRDEIYDREYRARNTEGEWVWIRARGRITEWDEQGLPIEVAGTYRLCGDARERAEQRRISVEIVRLMSEAVTVTTPDFRFVQVNPAFTRITGYAADEILGTDAVVLNSPRQEPGRYAAMRDALLRSGEWRGEMWQRHKDGRDFLAALEIREVLDGQGRRSHFLAVLEDVTERRRAEQTLRYLASHDMLTGLPNRSLMVQRLQQALLQARRRGNQLALLFLDLDRFKHVNDSLGHAAGDELLRQVARRISDTVGHRDRTARLGGDEFTVVLPDVYGLDQVQHLADALIDAFAAPIQLEAQEFMISPSIGIALFPEHAGSVEGLLKCADEAMYQAKRRGRNIAQIYSPELASGSSQRTQIESALRRALDQDELRLVYQPKLDVASRRIVGVEALLRWRSERLGEVPPDAFIPVAEDTGLILPIGEWVLRQGLAQLARWQQDPALAGLHMAINVSAAQVHRGDFTAMVQSLLSSQGVPPEQLELEITESVLMSDPLQGSLVGGDLRRLGVRICIDDFGTGYSSLSYLQRLSIDRLKIDQSFVQAIDGAGDGGVLASTMILMAHSLGLSVVAEGVCSREQWHYLLNEHCDEIQGYLVSPPLEVAECEAFLRAHRQGFELAPEESAELTA
ncbi:MAG: EAL domain-containing protein [Xanthomonadales bacterium]|nr:EAL domain-containing protein [Xanthomonadales bacterium]